MTVPELDVDGLESELAKVENDVQRWANSKVDEAEKYKNDYLQKLEDKEESARKLEAEERDYIALAKGANDGACGYCEYALFLSVLTTMSFRLNLFFASYFLLTSLSIFSSHGIKRSNELYHSKSPFVIQN